MNNVRNIRYRRGYKQAISIPRDLPAEVKPWAISVVKEIQSLRDDLERVRKSLDLDAIRKR